MERESNPDAFLISLDKTTFHLLFFTFAYGSLIEKKVLLSSVHARAEQERKMVHQKGKWVSSKNQARVMPDLGALGVAIRTVFIGWFCLRMYQLCICPNI